MATVQGEVDMAADYSTQVRVAESLPENLTLLKMENEQFMALARATPRKPAVVLAELKAYLDAYPQAADEAIYSKPVGSVGKVTCGGCGIVYEVAKLEEQSVCPVCQSGDRARQQVVKKFAEGLSVRAAETIRSAYGYTRYTVQTKILDDGKVSLAGTIIDYASGTMTGDERIVSPYYRSRDGRIARVPEDRFLNVTVKAEKAKLYRDLVLLNTPAIVKAMFRDACEDKLRSLVPPEMVEQKIVPAFAKYGISKEHLEQLLGHPVSTGMVEEERLQLRSILSALKNEETTVGELLGGLSLKKPTDQQQTKQQEAASGLAAAMAQPKGQAVESPHRDQPKTGEATGSAKESTSQGSPATGATNVSDSAIEAQSNSSASGASNPQSEQEPESSPAVAVSEPVTQPPTVSPLQEFLRRVHSAKTKAGLNGLKAEATKATELSDDDRAAVRAAVEERLSRL